MVAMNQYIQILTILEIKVYLQSPTLNVCICHSEQGDLFPFEDWTETN